MPDHNLPHGVIPIDLHGDHLLLLVSLWLAFIKLPTEDVCHFKHLPSVNKVTKIAQNSPLISSDSFEEDQHGIDLI